MSTFNQDVVVIGKGPVGAAGIDLGKRFTQ